MNHNGIWTYRSSVLHGLWISKRNDFGIPGVNHVMDDFGNLVPLDIPAFAIFVGNNLV